MAEVHLHPSGGGGQERLRSLLPDRRLLLSPFPLEHHRHRFAEGVSHGHHFSPTLTCISLSFSSRIWTAFTTISLAGRLPADSTFSTKLSPVFPSVREATLQGCHFACSFPLPSLA